MTTKQDKALHGKLVKLLALAEDGSGATEAERNAAMAKAQELAFKNALDLAQVETHEGEAPAKVDTATPFEGAVWEGDLLSYVCDVNFCRWFYSSIGGVRRRYTLYGKAHNVQAARDMFEYLREQVQRTTAHEVGLRDRRRQHARQVVALYAREQKITRKNKDGREVLDIPKALRTLLAEDKRGQGPLHGTEGYDYINRAIGRGHGTKRRDGSAAPKVSHSYAIEIRPLIRKGHLAPEVVDHMGTWRRNFIDGMVARIGTRLRNEYGGLVRAAGQRGTELVVNEDAALDAFKKGLGLETSSRSSTKYDAGAYGKGTAAGDAASLKERGSLDNRTKALGK